MNKLFQTFGRLEGASFLVLLLIAMPMKYYAENPAAVKLLGPVHGGLFLGYCFMAFYVSMNEKWPLKQLLLALAAAVIPFGTFLFERKYLSPRKS